MQHVCTIDLRSKELIVDVMEGIAQTDPSIEDDDPLYVATASLDEGKSDPVIVPGMKGDCCRSCFLLCLYNFSFSFGSFSILNLNSMQIMFLKSLRVYVLVIISLLMLIWRRR